MLTGVNHCSTCLKWVMIQLLDSPVEESLLEFCAVQVRLTYFYLKKKEKENMLKCCTSINGKFNDQFFFVLFLYPINFH